MCQKFETQSRVEKAERVSASKSSSERDLLMLRGEGSYFEANDHYRPKVWPSPGNLGAAAAGGAVLAWEEEEAAKLCGGGCAGSADSPRVSPD